MRVGMAHEERELRFEFNFPQLDNFKVDRL